MSARGSEKEKTTASNDVLGTFNPSVHIAQPYDIKVKRGGTKRRLLITGGELQTGEREKGINGVIAATLISLSIPEEGGELRRKRRRHGLDIGGAKTPFELDRCHSRGAPKVGKKKKTTGKPSRKRGKAKDSGNRTGGRKGPKRVRTRLTPEL